MTPCFLRGAVLCLAFLVGASGANERALSQDAPAAADAATADAATVDAATVDAATVEAPAAAVPEGEPAEAAVPVRPALPPSPITEPYRVEVSVAFASDPSLSRGVQLQLVEQLQRRLTSQFRALWRLETQLVAAFPEWSRQPTSPAIDAVAQEYFAERPFDKSFLLRVARSGAAYHVQCREWDAALRTLGPIVELSLAERRELSALMTQVVGKSFRPLADLEVLDGDRIEFLIRGGELPPRDPEQQLFRPGDYLQVALRYLDRKREVRNIQHLPWTYLRVEEIERSRMQLSLTSAFKSPIPATRRRVEVVGLRLRPHLDATEIRVIPRGSPLDPLVGVRCEVMDRLPTADDPVEDRLKLMTDRRGVVTVPYNPDSPVRYLHIYSGASLLARSPVLPGAERALEIEVPDDRARLNVEGEVALLQGELIDIVATREVLMARIRGLASRNDWASVDKFLEELRGLPTRDQFVARIDTLQVQAVFAAQEARDRVAESRIKRLCAGIRDSAGKHLDPARLENFRRDMAAQRPK